MAQIDNTKTRLDANQVIKRVYDENTESLKTSVQAVVSDVVINVDLDASEDSVAVSDPDSGNTLQINNDGSINAVLVSAEASRTVKSQFTEVTNVATGITTIVGSYVAAAGDFLQKIEFSGSNVAEYELVVNGTTEDKKRTYFTSLNGQFDFGAGIEIPAGQSVIVYVVHNRPTVGDFNVRIQLVEVGA